MSFTIVIKFSRPWCVKPFFERFNRIAFNRSSCNLLLINNTKNNALSDALSDAVRNDILDYKSYSLIQTDNPNFERYSSANLKGSPMPFHTWTAYFSFRMQQIIADVVNDPVHIQLEDDTIPPFNAINSLLSLINSDDKVAIASLPCCNREKAFNFVGMNSYDLLEKQGHRIVKRRSCDPNLLGLHEILATGYHCNAFKRDPFLKAVEYVDKLPIRIIGSGSDIYFTSYIVSLGFKILSDFNYWCDHLELTDGKIRTYTKKDCKRWLHIWNNKTNKYDYRFV